MSKDWYYYLFMCWIQDLNPQIRSQEKIKIIIILIIDYCRFVEIESEAGKVCRDT